MSAHRHCGEDDDKTDKQNGQLRAHLVLPHFPAFFFASARPPLSRFGSA
jgi:hypothetical protein